MTTRCRTAAVGLILGLAACSSGNPGPSRADPSGPPEVKLEFVDRHARQLDAELAHRPAGSQQEQVASQYLLGHLQRAGYPVRLEAVPVANLVESTNLLAFPPSGEEPNTIVTVAFDARESDDPQGHSIGVFLELARALYVTDEDHRVEFAALGAELTTDNRGSRRLAQQLREEGTDPVVVTVAGVAPSSALAFAGERSEEVSRVATDMGLDPSETDFASVGGVDVFGRAGFDHILATGPPDEVASVLLEWLRAQAD
jgi:hypothetical protein